MKREFDLNELTDEDVEIIEEALSTRRILKMCNPDNIRSNVSWFQTS